MAQDIRKMFENEEMKYPQLPEGHSERFAARLENEFPKDRQESRLGTSFLRIAAGLVVLMGIGFLVFTGNGIPGKEQVVETTEKEDYLKESPYQLSDFSPQFRKIEDYYVASLNIELAKLNVTPENKELVDSFMNQLAGLDSEYQRLNKEISEAGISESGINSLIANLQLRLDLLKKLKNKLKEINTPKQTDYENYEA